MSKNYTVAARFRTLGIYSMLVVGAVIFCWPLLWLAFTSVKMDRELFTRRIHWIPEAPRPHMVAPYVDAYSFPDLDGPRQDELLPVLQSYFRPLAPALDPDLDPDALSVQLARGAYQHLSDNLPETAWTQTQADLRKMALAAMNPALTKELLRQAERGVIVGPLSARSYDLQEQELVSAEQVAGAWKIDGGAKGSLVPSPADRGAELHYDFSSGDKLRLTGTFTTDFPVDRLYHLQLALRSDESWNRIRATLEKNGRVLRADRIFPLADTNWSVITWQEPGPDDLTNKLKTWLILNQVKGAQSGVTGPNTIKVTIEFERNSFWGAWKDKVELNYLKVFDNMPFWRYVETSLLLVILNLFGTLLSSSMVAYSFARLNWPGRNLSFGLMMATMMIPSQVTMIPFFLVIKYLGWYNTLMPLWVCSFFASAFNVFLLYNFFKGIPQDLEDAAKIDGCGPIRSYWYIMLPLVQPALATVAVFTFMGVWNDFMGPLIFLNDQRLYPLSLGLYALNVQGSDGSIGMSVMLAGSVLMMLPVIAIFFFAQRYFIQGITMTGLKG
ncbi:MAG TPA: carbohydrate ABC transporter permease [bacterium]|jgi:multiple sugar transport system permease protein|nr:carbohydrate ABC transporter permease [bacterium]